MASRLVGDLGSNTALERVRSPAECGQVRDDAVMQVAGNPRPLRADASLLQRIRQLGDVRIEVPRWPHSIHDPMVAP